MSDTHTETCRRENEQAEAEHPQVLLGELEAGDRFRVEQFPEGVITGTVDLAAPAAYTPEAFVEVAIDGDDEGNSSWPAETWVEPIDRQEGS